MRRVVFSQVDRARLHRLGLNTHQIDELESPALPICKAMLAEGPKMREVRSALRSPLTAINAAIKEIRDLRRKPTPAANEVRYRLIDAVESGDDPTELLDLAIRSLSSLADALKEAETRLPKAQRRHRSADHRVVERIAKALLDGFVKAYEPPFPRYTMTPSSSHNSKFYEIVSICYRTIGAGENPERAIREYIRITKERTARSRQEFGVAIE